MVSTSDTRPSSAYTFRLSPFSRSSTSSSSSPSSTPPSSPLLGKSSPDPASPPLPLSRSGSGSRSRIARLFWLILAFLSAMLLLRTFLAVAGPCIAAAACYRGFNSPFSFDAGALAHPSWMRALRNDTLLTSLSLPGTHDTMTYAIGSEVLQCQNANLSTQLAAGLRYFDVRARLRDDELHIYHGDADTGFSYQDVLFTMFNFLEAHPSEALVIRVKQEGTPIGEHNTRTFEEAFKYYRYQSALTAKQAYRYFYKWDPAAPLPTLGDLRSKILVLQNFPSDSNGPANKYGIAWEGNQMVLEDLWQIPDVNHLSDKWNAIRDALTKAASDPQDNKALYLSHISASVGVLPIEAAAGPKNRTVVGMNDETGRWLEAGDQKGRTGIVIFDFPGKRGVEAVLARNDIFKA